jgi:hypothetical protein
MTKKREFALRKPLLTPGESLSDSEKAEALTDSLEA